MGNVNSSSGSDRCRSEHQTCSTVCILTNSAPELGSSNIADAIGAGNCIQSTCQNRNNICRKNNGISAKSGVSAGDSNHATQFNNGRPYRKQDNKIYVYRGGEIPYDGKLWNGKSYVIYKNGVIVSWRDSNENSCDSEGYLGNEDTSNGH